MIPFLFSRVNKYFIRKINWHKKNNIFNKISNNNGKNREEIIYFNPIINYLIRFVSQAQNHAVGLEFFWESVMTALSISVVFGVSEFSHLSKT